MVSFQASYLDHFGSIHGWGGLPCFALIKETPCPSRSGQNPRNQKRPTPLPTDFGSLSISEAPKHHQTDCQDTPDTVGFGPKTKRRCAGSGRRDQKKAGHYQLVAHKGPKQRFFCGMKSDDFFNYIFFWGFR